MPSLVSIFLNFLPILLVIGVWWFFMSRLKRAGTPMADAQKAFMAEHLEETRRLNLTLERIATALETRGGADKI